eukprot:sb/3473456/
MFKRKPGRYKERERERDRERERERERRGELVHLRGELVHLRGELVHLPPPPIGSPRATGSHGVPFFPIPFSPCSFSRFVWPWLSVAVYQKYGKKSKNTKTQKTSSWLGGPQCIFANYYVPTPPSPAQGFPWNRHLPATCGPPTPLYPLTH